MDKKFLKTNISPAVPYLKNGLHLVKNKLSTFIGLFLVAKAYLTWQVLSRISDQKVIFHFYLSLIYKTGIQLNKQSYNFFVQLFSSLEFRQIRKNLF